MVYEEGEVVATGSEENPVSRMPIMTITPDILDGIPVGPDGRFALYKALDKITERKPGYWAMNMRQHVDLVNLTSQFPKYKFPQYARPTIMATLSELMQIQDRSVSHTRPRW